MCSDLQSASQGCAFFSGTGILFMSFVGVMLMKQPFFIGGIEDVEVAKGSAFGAAGMFFFTFLTSMLFLLKEGRRLQGLGLPVAISSPQQGRGYEQRFGEYSNVAFTDDPFQETQEEGTWT